MGSPRWLSPFSIPCSIPQPSRSFSASSSSLLSCLFDFFYFRSFRCPPLLLLSLLPAHSLSLGPSPFFVVPSCRLSPSPSYGCSLSHRAIPWVTSLCSRSLLSLRLKACVPRSRDPFHYVCLTPTCLALWWFLLSLLKLAYTFCDRHANVRCMRLTTQPVKLLSIYRPPWTRFAAAHLKHGTCSCYLLFV